MFLTLTALLVSNSVLFAWALTNSISSVTLVWLFFAENLIVGLFGTIKMAQTYGYAKKTGGSLRTEQGDGGYRGHPIIFFLLFYLFHSFYLIFLFILTVKYIHEINIQFIFWGVGIFFLSHGVSYIVSYQIQKVYKKITIAQLDKKLFLRVIPLHLVIFFGIALFRFLPDSFWILVLFFFTKIIMDALGHYNEKKGLM